MVGATEIRAFAAYARSASDSRTTGAGLVKTEMQQKLDDRLRGREALVERGVLYDPLAPCGCEKCASRLYQDGSNDSGVSLKAPTHLDPATARMAVAAHEGEHVKRESYQAQQGEMKVVGAQVRLFQRACSECGVIYCSGGVTTVDVRPDISMYKLLGLNVDKSL